MGQEQFSGPEYFTEFDPEKFIRDLKIQAEEAAKEKAEAVSYTHLTLPTID